MDTNQEFNLYPLASVLFLRRRYIITVTVAAVIAGTLFYFIKPKKYEAETMFILKNPLYADRNFLYNNETKFIDFFASEDDIGRLVTMSQSDSVLDKIIKDMHLATVYKADSTSPKALLKLKKKFSSNLKITRTDEKIVSLSYTDKDPDLAANIANTCVGLLEKSFRGFYNEMRMNMCLTISGKIKEEDSTINVLTDTLVKLREQYGIYDIISPARYNLMLTSMNPGGRKGYAKGMEQIQNLESIKDEYVSDRVRNITLANQYATGTRMNELALTKIIRVAKPPIKHIGTGLVAIAVASGITGFLFSIVSVLFISFYRKIASAN